MKEITKIFSLSLLLTSFLGFNSCSSDKEEPKDDPTPEEKPVQVTDLSADGMANCYIVQSPGYYKFKADNQFNLGEGLPVPPQIKPVSSGLIWQSGRSLISKVEFTNEEEGPYISFEVSEAEGNALIGAFDKTGKIVWSWHIWMPVGEINSIPSDTGYEVMNMNLGALDNKAGSVSSYGMLYQWGRKDPFPAAGTLTGDVNTLSAPMYDINNGTVLLKNSSWTDTENNTLEYSISNPTTVLSNYSQYVSSRDWLRADSSDDSLWGNPNGDQREDGTLDFINKGVKTCYDPSPLGWRVPPADVFRTFTVDGGYAWDMAAFNIADLNGDLIFDLADYNYGWHFMINPETPLYFPAAARFDGSYAMLMGSMSGLWGNYWSNSPYHSSNMVGGAYCALAFQVKDQFGNEMITTSPSAASSRADAFSIRCIRDNN